MLSIPSMDEKTRISFTLPLKAAFLLSKLIERATAPKPIDEQEFAVLDLVTGEVATALSLLPKEIWEKTGLTKFNDRLKSLTEKPA